MIKKFPPNSHRFIELFQIIVFMLLFLNFCTKIGYSQWLQWGGPNRNFKVDSAQLKTAWTEEEPRQLWKRQLGEGYSAICVDQGTLYTMFRRGDEDAVTALSADTGKTLWEYAYTSLPWKEFSEQYGPGPHATPLIVGDYIYAIGFRTELTCLDKKNGQKIWSHNLWDEYNAKPGDRGYASSPMAYKDLLIVLAGGKGHGVMAFNLRDGRLIWKGQDFINSYSSPIIINVDGQDQLIAFVEKKVAALDPNTGDLLWQHAHNTQYQIHASTPIWGKDNILFISSASDAGSRALHLSLQNGKTVVEELWYNKKVRVQHGSAVRMGETIYASSGHGPAFLTAVTVKTGEITTQQRGFGKANLMMAGKQMIILDETGQLAIVNANPDSFEVLVQAQVLTSRSWTAPTLAGTKLYLRDMKEILALDLSP
jgi:outer membrane protein assembly factor BamB